MPAFPGPVVHHALVTGGSRGVGLALARALLAEGYRVAICGRDALALAAAARTLGDGVVTIECDVSRPDELRALVAALPERLGGLSMLVNNAAVQRLRSFTTDPPGVLLADAADEIAINLSAPIQLTALCLPPLLDHVRRARAAENTAESLIVNVTSGLALAPKRTAPVYCATKAGLRTFTRALSYQLAAGDTGVRVVEAMLPLVDTAMTAGRGRGKLSPDAAAAAILRGVARGETEIHVGKVRVLALLARLVPRLATGCSATAEWAGRPATSARSRYGGMPWRQCSLLPGARWSARWKAMNAWMAARADGSAVVIRSSAPPGRSVTA